MDMRMEIQLGLHIEYIYICSTRCISKRAREGLKKILKSLNKSWKNINKFTVASGFSQLEP